MAENKKYKPIHIVHVIGSLVPGGAEFVLARLLEKSHLEQYPSTVISLTDREGLGKRIEDAGVRVITIGMKRGIGLPGSIFRLCKILKELKPDVIQSWMYHSNFLLAFLKPILPKHALVWSIHHTSFNPAEDKRGTIWIGKNASRLTSRVDKILCCSEASKEAHLELGYPLDRMVVIPNGYDVQRFSPDRKTRLGIRTEWQVPDRAIVIGAAGRFHPQKDYRNFLEAAALLSARNQLVMYMLCGRGVAEDNTELTNWIDSSGLRQHVRLLGEQKDMVRFYNGLDIFTLSASHGEAFPNVISEAMACGVPCVVTDVGDAALIVGDSGVVVSPKDAHALAAGWSQLIDLPEDKMAELGQSARERIKNHFSLEKMVEKYESLYLAAHQY